MAPAPTPGRSTTSPTRSTVRKVAAALITLRREDDNVTVQGVSGDQGALGYFGLWSYYEQNKDTLRRLENDGGHGCLAPSIDTSQTWHVHPALRPPFIYANTESFNAAQVRVRPVMLDKSSTSRGGAVRAADRRAAAQARADLAAAPAGYRPRLGSARAGSAPAASATASPWPRDCSGFCALISVSHDRRDPSRRSSSPRSSSSRTFRSSTS